MRNAVRPSTDRSVYHGRLEPCARPSPCLTQIPLINRGSRSRMGGSEHDLPAYPAFPASTASSSAGNALERLSKEANTGPALMERYDKW